MKKNNQISGYSDMSLIWNLATQIDHLKSEAWFYCSKKFQYCLQVSDFILKTKSISCMQNQLCYEGNFMYSNGKNFTIPSAYHQLFILSLNKNSQNIMFCVQQDRNQLVLKYMFTFDPNFSTLDKINQCILSIKKIIPDLQRVFQIFGIKHNFNKNTLQIKKKQLGLKSTLAKAINSNNVKQNLDDKTIKQQKISVFKVKDIVEAPSQKFNSTPAIKKGGYFQVQKKHTIVYRQSGQVEEKQLAWKTPHNNVLNKNFIQQKIQRQIQLVKKIICNKYLLNYYITEKDPNSFYMDFAPISLKDKVYNTSTLTHMLNLAQQLVEAIALLHKSQLVHRDLKPQNILIQGQTLKIIDYAESAMVHQQFNQKYYLGYTLPYSPIQCMLGKQEGFNKKQIDLWSLAFILYQMTFKSLPLNYNLYIGRDIVQKWRSSYEFCIYPIFRKRNGLRYVEQIMSLLTIRGIQVDPENRLSLKTFNKVILSLKQFCQTFINLS